MMDDAYRERRYIREDIVEAFRDAAAAHVRAEEQERKAYGAWTSAQQALIAEIEAVARGRVRRAHTDWFHPNGDKRGAYRQQIDDAFKATRFELWQTLFPDRPNLEMFSPFSPPPRRCAEDEETATQRVERAERLAKAQASEKQREAQMLAEEEDPERRNRVIRARERVVALEADPQVQAAKAAFNAALAAASDNRVTTKRH